MIKIGVIGTGFMAVQHLKAYAQVPEACVVALCNPSGRHLDGNFAGVAGNVGDGAMLQLDMSQVRAYRNPEDLFADPQVQVVDICTPTRTHLALAVGALTGGKHVLLEKPVARSSGDARKIAAAAAIAREAGRFLMPAMCIRFWPAYAWLHSLVKNGAYGAVRDARFRRVAQMPGWGHGHFLQGAESGGALFDLHIHDVDFAQYCFGRPAGITARGYSKVSGAIDHVVALYEYVQGPIVSLEGSWGMTNGFGFNMSFTLNFERATADFDSSRGAEALRLFVEGHEPQTIHPPGIDGYVGELSYFLGEIAEGRAPAVVTADDAVSALELCEAEQASIEASTTVHL